LVVAAFDKDPQCVEVYKQNFKCDHVFARDILELLDGTIGSEPTANEQSLLRQVGTVDVLLAGPPCQGNSDLNNQTRRNDPRNSLYERVARFVELFRPEHILIENVPMATHGKEGAVQRTVERILGLGYHVDCGIVDLSIIGVPQKRKRHIVVASRSKVISIRDVIRKYAVASPRSVRWAIGDLQNESHDSIFTTPSRLSIENNHRIQYLYKHSLFDLPNRLRPSCHRDGHSYKSMYGRLRATEVAQTITSGFGSPGQGRYIHPTQKRALTPHEAARLQFFPNFFDFSAARERVPLARMIGNAAPMKLSYVFCLELLA
jgi:DNA (cytosine-5)-methyltransferase 1